MTRFLSSVCILTLGVASPALADVTAEALWAEWQANASLLGQTMTATVTPTGSGLMLADFTSSMTQDGVSSVGRLDSVTLTENGDGTVSVALSEVYTLTVTFPEYEGGPTVNLGMELRHEGLDIQVSGAPGDLTYAYTADAITASEGEIFSTSGEPAPEINLDIVMRDLVTTYRVTGAAGGPQSFESTGTLGSLAMAVGVVPQDIDGRLKVAFAAEDFASTASGAILSLATMGQMQDGLPEGFEFAGATTYGALLMDVQFRDGGDSFDARYTNAGGRFGFDFGAESFGYDIAATAPQVTASGSEIPVPVSAGAASGEIRFVVPLAASDTASDASVRIAYRDVTVGDALWGMIDPLGGLPRAPATIVLDAAAQVRLMVDLTDPETLADLDGPPGVVDSVTLNDLTLSIGGATLTGTGAATITGWETTPMPVGSVDLALAGGNGLIDTLVGAGMVAAEQAAMARGLAGMFARPGAGPDTLETTIEFLEGGSITANGIPLR